MRDIIKTSDYFKRYIQKEMTKIIKREGLINQVISQRGEDDTVRMARLSVLNYRISILVATYSSVEDLNSIKKLLSDTINQIEKTSFTNRYVEMLWLVSMGVLLEIPMSEFEILTKIVDRDNLNDYLMGTLILSRNKNWKPPVKTVKFMNPYNSFLEIIGAPDKLLAEKKLKQYLEKEWYKGHSDCGWYDTHKEKEDLYFGYWCFESAAIVKILELDDSSFKNIKYYPYDLVHWNS